MLHLYSDKIETDNFNDIELIFIDEDLPIDSNIVVEKI